MQKKNNKKVNEIASQFENFINKQKAVNPNYDDGPIRDQMHALLTGAAKDPHFDVSVQPSWGIIPGAIPGVDVKGAVPPFLEVTMRGTTYLPPDATEKQEEEFEPYDVTTTTHLGAGGEQFFMGHAVAGYVQDGRKAPSMAIFTKGLRAGLDMQSEKNLSDDFPGPEKGGLNNQMNSAVFQVLTNSVEGFMPAEKSFLSFVGYNPQKTPFFASAANLVTPSSERDRSQLMYFNEDGQFAYNSGVFDILPGEAVDEGNGLFTFAGKQTGVGKNFKQAAHSHVDFDTPEYGQSFVVSKGRSYGSASPGVQFGIVLPFWVGEQGGSGASIRNTEVEHPEVYDVRRRQINAIGESFTQNDIFYKMFDVAANGLNKTNNSFGVDSRGEELRMDLSKASTGHSELQTGVFHGDESQRVWFEEAKDRWIADNPDADVPNLQWRSSGRVVLSREETPITFEGIFRDPVRTDENQNMKYTSFKGLTYDANFDEKFSTESSRGASYAYNAENFKGAGPFMIEMVDAGLRTIHRDLVDKGSSVQDASATIGNMLQSAGITTFGPHGVNYEVNTRQDLEGVHALYTAMHGATKEFNGDKDAAIGIFGGNASRKDDDPVPEREYGRRKYLEINSLARDAGIRGVHQEEITEEKAAFDFHLGITDAHAYAYIAPDLSNVDFTGIEPGNGIKHPGDFDGQMLEIFDRSERLEEARAEKFEGVKYETFDRSAELEAARAERFEGEKYELFNRSEQLKAALDEEFGGEKYELYDNGEQVEAALDKAYKVDKSTGKTYYDPSVADRAPRFRISVRETKEFSEHRVRIGSLPDADDLKDLTRETKEYREYRARMAALPNASPRMTRETKEYREYRARMAAIPDNVPMLIRETKEYREHKEAEALYHEARDARIARIKTKMRSQMQARAELAEAKRAQGWDVPEAGQFADKTKINMVMDGRNIVMQAKMQANVIHFAHAPIPRRSIQYNNGPLKQGVSANIAEQVEYMIPGEGVAMSERSLRDPSGRQVGALSLIASTIKRSDGNGGVIYGAKLDDSATTVVRFGEDRPEGAIDFTAAMKNAEAAYKTEYGVDKVPADGVPGRFALTALKEEFGENAQFQFGVEGDFAKREFVRDNEGRIQTDEAGRPKLRTVSYSGLDVTTPTLKAVERSFASQPKVLNSFINMIQLASTGTDTESIIQAHTRFQRAVDNQVLDDQLTVRKEMAKTASSSFPGGVMGGKHQVDRSVKPGEMNASLGWLEKQYNRLEGYYADEGMTFGDYMTAVTRGKIFEIVDRAPDQRAENAELLKVNFDPDLRGETTRISNSTNVSHTSDNDDDSFIAIPLTMHKDDKGQWGMSKDVEDAWRRRYEEPNKWLTQRHPEDVTGLEGRAQMYELTGELSEALGDLEKVSKTEMKGFADIDTMRTAPSTMSERMAIEREAANKERMRKNYKMASLATAHAVQYRKLFAPKLSQKETDNVSNQFSKAYQYAIDKTETHLNNIIDTMSQAIYKDGRVLTRAGGGGRYQDAYAPLISDMVALVETGAMSPKNVEAMLRYGSKKKNKGLLKVLKKVEKGKLKGGDAYKAVATQHGGLGDRRFWDESLLGSWLSFMKQKKFESGGLEEESPAGMMGRTYPLNNSDKPETWIANAATRAGVSAIFRPLRGAIGGIVNIGQTTSQERSRNAMQDSQDAGTDAANEMIDDAQQALASAGNEAQQTQAPTGNEVYENNPDIAGMGDLPGVEGGNVEKPESKAKKPAEGAAAGGGGGGKKPPETAVGGGEKPDNDGNEKAEQNKPLNMDVIGLIDQTVRAKHRVAAEYRDKKRVEQLSEKYSVKSITKAMTHYAGDHERLLGALKDSKKQYKKIGDDPFNPIGGDVIRASGQALNDLGDRIGLLGDYRDVLQNKVDGVYDTARELMVKQGHSTVESVFNDPQNKSLQKEYEEAKGAQKVVDKELDKLTSKKARRDAMIVTAQRTSLREAGYAAKLSDPDAAAAAEHTAKMERKKRIGKDYADIKQREAFQVKVNKAETRGDLSRLTEEDVVHVREATFTALRLNSGLSELTPGTEAYATKLRQVGRVISSATNQFNAMAKVEAMRIDAKGFGVAQPFQNLKLESEWVSGFRDVQRQYAKDSLLHASNEHLMDPEKEIRAITEGADKLRQKYDLTATARADITKRSDDAIAATSHVENKITSFPAKYPIGSPERKQLISDVGNLLTAGRKITSPHKEAAELNRRAEAIGISKPFPGLDIHEADWSNMQRIHAGFLLDEAEYEANLSLDDKKAREATKKESKRTRKRSDASHDKFIEQLSKHRERVESIKKIELGTETQNSLQELIDHPEDFTEAEAKKILQLAKPAHDAYAAAKDLQERGGSAYDNFIERARKVTSGSDEEHALRQARNKAATMMHAAEDQATRLGGAAIYEDAKASFQNYQSGAGVYNLADEKQREMALKQARKNLSKEGAYDHATSISKATMQKDNIEIVGKGVKDLNKHIKDFAAAMGKSTRALDPYAEQTIELTEKAKAMVERYDRIDKQLAHTERNISDRNITFRAEADKSKDPALAGLPLGSRARAEAFGTIMGRTDIKESFDELDDIKTKRAASRKDRGELEDFLETMDARRATEDPSVASRIEKRKRAGGTKDRSGLGGLGFALFNAQRINRWTFGAATSWGKQFASDQQMVTQAMFNRTGEVNTSKATRLYYDMEAAPSRLKSRLGEVWMERYGEGWIDRITNLADQPDDRLAPITDATMWGGGIMMSQLAMSTLGNVTGAKWLGNMGPIGFTNLVASKGASYAGNELLKNSETMAFGYASGGNWGAIKAGAGALGSIGIGGGVTLGGAAAVALPVAAVAGLSYAGYRAYEAGERSRKEAREAFGEFVDTKDISATEKDFLIKDAGLDDVAETEDLYRDYTKERNAITGQLDGDPNFWEKLSQGMKAGSAGVAWQSVGIASLTSDAGKKAEEQYSDEANVAMGEYTPASKKKVKQKLIDKGYDPGKVNKLVGKLDAMGSDELEKFINQDSESTKFKKQIEEWSKGHELSFGQGYTIAIEYEKMSGKEITREEFDKYAETSRGYGGNIGEMLGIQQSILSMSNASMGTPKYAAAMSELGPVTATNAPAMQFAMSEASKYGVSAGYSPTDIIREAKGDLSAVQNSTQEERKLIGERQNTISSGYSQIGIGPKNISQRNMLIPLIGDWTRDEENRWAGGAGMATQITTSGGELGYGERIDETGRLLSLTDPLAARFQGIPLDPGIVSYLAGKKKTFLGVSKEEAYDYETRVRGVAGYGLGLDIKDSAVRSRIDFSHPADDLLGNQLSKMFASTIAGIPRIEGDDDFKERIDKAISSGKYGRNTIQRALSGIRSRTLQGDSVGTDKYTRGFFEDIGYNSPVMQGQEPAYDSLGNKWSEYHEWTQGGVTYSPMYEYNAQMQRFGLESQRAQGAYGIYKSEWQIKNLQREYHSSSSGRNLWDINADRSKLAKNKTISASDREAKTKALDVEQQSLGLAQQEYQIRRDMWEQSIGFQKQGIQLQRQSLALQREEHGFQRKFALSEKKAERGMKMIERGWQHEDFDIQTNRFEVKADWQMEDVNRNIRYSFGRQRLDLLRKKKRMITEQNWSREDRGRALSRRDTKEGYEDERWEKYLGYEEKMEEFAQRRFAISEAQLNLQEAQLDAQVAAQKKLNTIEDQRFKDTVTFHQGEIGHLNKILQIDIKRQAFLEKNFDKLMANIDHWVDKILAKLKENEDPPPPPDPNEDAEEYIKRKGHGGGGNKDQGATLPPGSGGSGSGGAYGGGNIGPNGAIKVELELAADGESFGTTTFFIDAVQAANQMGESI